MLAGYSTCSRGQAYYVINGRLAAPDLKAGRVNHSVHVSDYMYHMPSTKAHLDLEKVTHAFFFLDSMSSIHMEYYPYDFDPVT